MIRTLACAVMGALVMVGAVWSNAGPSPLPKDHRVAEPPLRFEGIDKHPEYIFHVYYYGYHLPRTLIEVKDANVIKLDFKRKNSAPEVEYMALKAVDRKEFDKRQKADPALKWMDELKAAGVLTVKLTPPKTTVPIATKEIPVTSYRVTIKDGKMNVEKLEDAKRDAAAPPGLLPTWMFGIVGSLSFAWFGIWLARRDPARRLGQKAAE